MPQLYVLTKSEQARRPTTPPEGELSRRRKMRENLSSFNPFTALSPAEFQPRALNAIELVLFSHPLYSMLEKFYPACPRCGLKMYRGLGSIWSCFCQQKDNPLRLFSCNLTPQAF